MSEKHTLYPTLPEAGQLEAQAIMDSFKAKIKKVIDEVLGELYCDVAVYIESDSWTNFRNELLDGFRDYNNSKVQGQYDFKIIRQAILKEHREDVIKDLNQDLVKEVEQLKEQVEFMRKMNESRY